MAKAVSWISWWDKIWPGSVDWVIWQIPAHIRKTLESIYKYNHVVSFGDHFNNMRSYALGDESGLMLTSYPDPSKRPAVPLSYAFEAWTGLEYTAATGMIYEDMNTEALENYFGCPEPL